MNKSVVVKLTPHELSKMLSSPIQLFGDRCDIHVRICPKHALSFAKAYVKHLNQRYDDDDYWESWHNAPLLVKHCDLPECLKEYAVRPQERKDNQRHADFLALSYYIKDGMFHIFFDPKDATISSMARFYNQQIEKDLVGCAGCCMSMVHVAVMNRTKKVYRPNRMVGLPEGVKWENVTGPQFYHLLHEFDKLIYCNVTRFIKDENLHTWNFVGLRRLMFQFLFPEEYAKQQAEIEAKRQAELVAEIKRQKAKAEARTAARLKELARQKEQKEEEELKRRQEEDARLKELQRRQEEAAAAAFILELNDFPPLGS